MGEGTFSAPRVGVPGLLLSLALSLVLPLLTGCGASANPYVAPRLSFRAPPEDTLVAVMSVVDRLGLRVSFARTDAHRVVAYSNPARMSGLTVRDRWVFDVNGGEVQVTLHAQKHNTETHRWETVTDICDCYYYSRENEMLEAVRAVAERRPGSLQAALRVHAAR